MERRTRLFSCVSSYGGRNLIQMPLKRFPNLQLVDAKKSIRSPKFPLKPMDRHDDDGDDDDGDDDDGDDDSDFGDDDGDDGDVYSLPGRCGAFRPPCFCPRSSVSGSCHPSDRAAKYKI